MTDNYVTLSLETHLFFARIMKEHALFLEAGFPCKEQIWIQKAAYFRQQFEILLMEVVQISNGRINEPVLNSSELITKFTIPAERKTETLTGIPINTELSQMETALRPASVQNTKGTNRSTNNRRLIRLVHKLNERSIALLNGLIDFKKSILREVRKCRLFTFNYPLLIEHILREAQLYRTSIDNLMHNRTISYSVPYETARRASGQGHSKSVPYETARRASGQGHSKSVLLGTEDFWNQIMMEHALFIRGLLDPSEEDLIAAANTFAAEYKLLLKTEEKQDCTEAENSANASLEETLKYRDFKAAGANGILNCEIASLILPLLADHVLREANHYIRILESGCNCSE